MGGDIDLVTGKPVKNKERELLVALTPEEKRAQKEARAAEMAAKREEAQRRKEEERRIRLGKRRRRIARCC